ncbi:hypothetical protein PG999_005578 [Apiospora kogelbergensis]|uniref:Uncharacterized protein n=1 Tax=Apiospora kogelbergensis TaxID=1337665 RepID=A0AAW0R2K8_9PEZI
MVLKRDETLGGGKGRDDANERRLAAIEKKLQQLGFMTGRILQALKDTSEKQEETSMANAKTLNEVFDVALKDGDDEDNGVQCHRNPAEQVKWITSVSLVHRADLGAARQLRPGSHHGPSANILMGESAYPQRSMLL